MSTRLQTAAVAAGLAGLGLVAAGVAPGWMAQAVPADISPQIVRYARQMLAATGLLLLCAAFFVAVVDPARHQRWSAALSLHRWAPRLAALAVLLYVAVYFPFTAQRYWHFNAGVYDLGVQDQVVWNTAHGRWYASSIEVGNYMGDHFKPLVALLAPFYLIAPSVYWLLAFQTVVLALGAVPVYRLAQRRLGAPGFGLLFALLYLLYPSVGYVNRFDFHWEAAAIPLLLAAIDDTDAKRWRRASLWLALALLSKEDIGLTVAAFGLWLAWRRQALRFGLAWAAAGIGFALFAMFVIIPAFRAAPSDSFVRYLWLGADPIEMLRNLLLRPDLVLPRLLGVDAVRFVVSFTAPLLFLPFAHTIILVALPAAVYNLLSTEMAQRVAYFHYVAPIVPFVIAAALLASARIFAWARRVQAYWLVWTICTGLLIFTGWHSLVFNNPLADDGAVPPAWTRLPNEAAVRQALSLIPPEAAVLTTNYYGTHLAHRTDLYLMFAPADTTGLEPAELALFNTIDYRSHHPWACQDYAAALQQAHDQGFGLVYNVERVVLVQRAAGDRAALRELASALCRDEPHASEHASEHAHEHAHEHAYEEVQP